MFKPPLVCFIAAATRVVVYPAAKAAYSRRPKRRAPARRLGLLRALTNVSARPHKKLLPPAPAHALFPFAAFDTRKEGAAS